MMETITITDIIRCVLTLINVTLLSIIAPACFIVKFQNKRPFILGGVGFSLLLIVFNLILLTQLFWIFKNNIIQYIEYNESLLVFFQSGIYWIISTLEVMAFSFILISTIILIRALRIKC